MRRKNKLKSFMKTKEKKNKYKNFNLNELTAVILSCKGKGIFKHLKKETK